MSSLPALDGTSLRGIVPQRAAAALLAGALAIAVNTALLAAADVIPLVTAHGGLLKLVKIGVGDILVRLGAGALWAQSGLPAPGSTTFQSGFHVVAGLGMALVYGMAIEPALPGPAWRKGVIYAVVVWVANAVVILPWLGEGFAGSRNLSLPGMAYFAAAHTVFFVLLAVLFARFRPAATRLS